MIRLTTGAVILDRYRVIAPSPWDEARGSVTLAYDQRLGRHVDLVLAPEPAATPVGDLFRRRAHAIAVLHHPILPQVLDMGLHHGHVVLVYQHADGRLLADLAAYEQQGWSAEQVLQLVRDLATALGLAHAQGLCHGAFGAQSVLVEQNGTATLLDLIWPRPGTHVDPADVAPEVRRGYTPSPRADVFALGRLLLRLLEQAGPQAGRELGDAVRAVVRTATAWAPRERYADGAAMARAIEPLVAALPPAQLSVQVDRPRVVTPHPHAVAVPVHSRRTAAPDARPRATPATPRPVRGGLVHS